MENDLAQNNTLLTKMLTRNFILDLKGAVKHKVITMIKLTDPKNILQGGRVGGIHVY